MDTSEIQESVVSHKAQANFGSDVEEPGGKAEAQASVGFDVKEPVASAEGSASDGSEGTGKRKGMALKGKRVSGTRKATKKKYREAQSRTLITHKTDGKCHSTLVTVTSVFVLLVTQSF